MLVNPSVDMQLLLDRLAQWYNETKAAKEIYVQVLSK